MRCYLFFLVLLAMPVHAEPVVKTRYVYYAVSSMTRHEMLANLNRATPVRIDGQIFHGSTQSDIRWEFRWQMKNNRCRITKVKVFVDATITLPKLKQSPMEVYEVWKRWYPKLVGHEKQHRSNAVSVARRIEKGIRNLAPNRSCNTLEKNANQLGQKLIRELAKIDEAYDRHTNHGQTEGSRLQDYL